MQTVVAGLIWREGKLLIGQRRNSVPHPLRWEFPGGKVEPGETEERALIRELYEELQITARLGLEFARYEFAYPGGLPLQLVFFMIESYTGKAENTGVFESIAWEVPGRLAAYPFLEGDLPLIQLLGKFHVNQVE